MRLILFFTCGVLLAQETDEKPLPVLTLSSITDYWIAEATAQAAEVAMLKARADRDAKMEILHAQCGPFKLVVIDQKRLLCSK